MHLFNNCGELMLMHDQVVPFTLRNKSGYRNKYDMYRVNLDTGALSHLKSLGGGRAGDNPQVYGIVVASFDK